MPHVIEYAASGRAKCRGCELKIAKDEPRFGERQPNAFGEGEMTLWFHLPCAAYKRPEPFLEVLDDAASLEVSEDDLAVARGFRTSAELGVEHRRVPRLNEVNLAPTGRARCRSCRELVEKDTWRIGLVFFEEYRFQPSGFIHVRCAKEYFGTIEIMDRVLHFNPALIPAELDAIAAGME